MADHTREPSLFDAAGSHGSREPFTDHSVPEGTRVTDATWGVAELHEAINALFSEGFGTSIWVTGELRSLKRSTKGHTYFDLVEPDSAGDYDAPKLNVTLFAGRRRQVNTRIRGAGGRVGFEDGTLLRIRGQLRTYGSRSTVQLLMTDIDPAHTLGVVAQRREAVLAALAEDDLLTRNAGTPLRQPQIRLAVVTSGGSAAEADVRHELERCGIGFSVSCIDARTQGADAERSVVAALRTAEGMGVDVVLLVRGGGSATDLAVFDSERIARCIATLSVPVFTGIGHETDRSVADEVAHSSHKTPTAAAAAVVTAALDARRSVDQAAALVGSAATGSLERAGRHLDAASRNTALACRSHLHREERLLSTRLERIASAAPRALDPAAARLREVSLRLADSARSTHSRASDRLDTIASLLDAHDPRRMMERGWSLVHDPDGNLVRSSTQVRSGDPIVTTLADGRLLSTVTAREPADGPPSENEDVNR